MVTADNGDRRHSDQPTTPKRHPNVDPYVSLTGPQTLTHTCPYGAKRLQTFQMALNGSKRLQDNRNDARPASAHFLLSSRCLL